MAVPHAYQPSSAKPRIKSASLLPISPKQKRPISTVLRPLRAAIQPSDAAYRASKALPMKAIHSRLTMEKETPSLPPANIVPVKKVKLNNTMAMENTPLRPAAGASTRGKSLLFDILEPLAG